MVSRVFHYMASLISRYYIVYAGIYAGGSVEWIQEGISGCIRWGEMVLRVVPFIMLGGSESTTTFIECIGHSL